MMSKEEKQGIREISIRMVKVVLLCMLVFNALVFIYFGLINKASVLDVEPVRYIENWTVVEKDGTETSVGRRYESTQDYYANICVYSTLPQGIQDHEYLFVETRKDVAIYVGGELREEFIEKRDVNVPGGSVKSFYMMIPLETSDSGAEVRIVRTSDFNDGLIISETFISTRFGAFAHMMRNGGMAFILASIVLIFSFVVLLVSIGLRFVFKMRINMMYGALGILVLASWLLTDSYVFPFVFGVYHVNGLINYLICLMIPLAPAIYLNSVQKGRYGASMSVVMIVSALNAVIVPILHFTGICTFYDIRTVENLILVGLTLYAIIILIYDAMNRKISEYQYTYIGFLGFLICCVVELLLLLLLGIKGSLPMVMGLSFLLVFVVIQQVDDIRKINQEKQHAINISEAKTRFLAGMSHEIRTPINAILGMNEMILRENKDEVIEEYSKSIKSSGKMLLMLVNDVLDFSKIEAGKMEINAAGFRMSEMLGDVLSLVRERADEKGLMLKTEIRGEIPNEMESDEFRIRQILVNIMNNAVKYTDRGTITLVLEGNDLGEGYELCLRVKDTGKGIRKEDQEHLFEAFSRVDMKANANIEGTGLGLAIVKSIVDSMNGSIGVESEYGVGSEFWVKLPMKVLSKEPLSSDFMNQETKRKEVGETSGFTAPDAKVLAVDDNQSNLTIVKLFLKRTGIQLDICSSGNGAIELCREKKYDLILLDHMMPAPDGIETLRMIRADERSLNRDVKAVVLTANAIAGSRQTYLDAGFEEYLTKPLDSKLLEQTVRELLPQDKVLRIQQEESVVEDMDRGALATEALGLGEGGASLKARLASIEGLNYQVAMGHCADDEELLEEILHDMAVDCGERTERMRKSIAEGDIKSYEIDAHSVKSSMATIGLMALSERAKKHEFAAKANDVQFIGKDAEDFLREYEETCKKLGEI